MRFPRKLISLIPLSAVDIISLQYYPIHSIMNTAVPDIPIIPDAPTTSGSIQVEAHVPNLVKHGDFGGFIDTHGKATCTDCHLEKPNSEFVFYKNRVNPTSKLCLYTNKKCKDCGKIYAEHKKKSEQQVKEQNIVRPIPSLEQPYPCDNCGKNIITTRTIQLDHCHETGKFRGWLCKECNISLGNLGDNIEGLIHTIKYLNRTQQKTTEEIIEMIRNIM